MYRPPAQPPYQPLVWSYGYIYIYNIYIYILFSYLGSRAGVIHCRSIVPGQCLSLRFAYAGPRSKFLHLVPHFARQMLAIMYAQALREQMAMNSELRRRSADDDGSSNCSRGQGSVRGSSSGCPLPSSSRGPKVLRQPCTAAVKLARIPCGAKRLLLAGHGGQARWHFWALADRRAQFLESIYTARLHGGLFLRPLCSSEAYQRRLQFVF